MSNFIEVQILDEKEINRQLKRLSNIKKGTPTAMMRAMNRTVTGMKTDASKEIRKKYVIKQKDFFDKLAVRKASMNNLSVELYSKGRPIRLVKFQTRANDTSGSREEYIGRSFRRKKRSKERGKDKRSRKRGGGGWNKGKKSVYARNLKTSSLKKTGGFMATMSSTNGITGAFARTKEKQRVSRGRYRGLIREKIEQLHGPGVVQMLENESVRLEVQNGASERFEKELNHQIEHLLRQ